jgi:CheY-like chemotaxis protein
MDIHQARVIVIEDNADSQEVVTRILRHMRLNVELAASAEEAIQLLEQNTFDLAVIDLALPKMDGWGLLEVIRKNTNTNTMITIAVTAFHSPEVAVQAIRAGFSAYFPKPLDSTHFVRQLQELLAN